MPSGFFGAFIVTPAELASALFRSDGSFVRMVVGSGATDNYIDPELVPGVLDHMLDTEDLPFPYPVVGVGGTILEDVSTRAILCTVMDDNGCDRAFHLILVPGLGLGSHLLSVCSAMRKGVAALFYPENPRLETMDGTCTVPMTPHGVDKTDKLLCCVQIKLQGGAGGVIENGSDGLALKVESADLWHRRMGDINSKSLDILRKEPSNGVDYT